MLRDYPAFVHCAKWSPPYTEPSEWHCTWADCREEFCLSEYKWFHGCSRPRHKTSPNTPKSRHQLWLRRHPIRWSRKNFNPNDTLQATTKAHSFVKEIIEGSQTLSSLLENRSEYCNERIKVLQFLNSMTDVVVPSKTYNQASINNWHRNVCWRVSSMPGL